MTSTTTRHRVIPFDSMTDKEQVEHLMTAHGFTEEYGYADESGRDLTHEEVRAMHAALGREGRADYHDDDHDYLADDPEVLSVTVRHTHDKPMPTD